MLRCDREAVATALESGEQLDEDGIADAFELQTETSEAVRTGERDHPLLLSRSAHFVTTDVSQQEPETYQTMHAPEVSHDAVIAHGQSAGTEHW